MEISDFRIADVDIGSAAFQVTVPLVSHRDGVSVCHGTGVMIAPGLALTAAHVADAWLAQGRHGQSEDDPAAGLGVSAIQMVGDGTFVEWTAKSFVVARSEELAIVEFLRPAWWGTAEGQHRPRYARLNLLPPKRDELIRIVGFPASSLSDGGVLQVRSVECIAKVLRHQPLSETASRPHSYVEVDGEIAPGMSGGPAFDKDWNVVAINSRGMDSGDSFPPLGTLALVWPVLNTNIDLFGDGGQSLFQFLDHDSRRPVGFDAVRLTHTSEVRIAVHTPSDAKRVPVDRALEGLAGMLRFIHGAATEDLKVVRASIDDADSTNGLYRALRGFFWNLESLISTAANLAAARLNLPEPKDVGSLLVELDGNPMVTDTDRDELFVLKCGWWSSEMFELVTYAASARSGDPFAVQVISSRSGAGLAQQAFIQACREGQPLTPIPSALDVYLTRAYRFALGIDRVSQRLAGSGA